MTDWTRNDSIALGQIAHQVGLTPKEADRALTIGAKIVAMGFSDEAFEHMRCDYMEMRRKSWERWGR